jgi:hypothetical protein
MKINTCFLLVKNTTKFLITGILLIKSIVNWHYAFIQRILGLGPVAAFIHVNKAIDKTLLVASVGAADDYAIHERQLAALAATRFWVGSPRTINDSVIMQWMMTDY